MTSKEYIKDIILNGTAEDNRSLFAFTVEDTNEKILKKFRLYARSNFPRYFKYKDAPYHHDMVCDYIDSYKGIQNVLDGAHRDAAKTSLIKLFIAFVIQNCYSTNLTFEARPALAAYISCNFQWRRDFLIFYWRIYNNSFLYRRNLSRRWRRFIKNQYAN